MSNTATTTKTPDKYDAAIAYLTEHPEEIERAWEDPHQHKAGCLFVYATPTGASVYENTRTCGCLTQVRGLGMSAFNHEFTTRIRGDSRIPVFGHDITPAHLPIFAEYRRELDALATASPEDQHEIEERWDAQS